MNYELLTWFFENICRNTKADTGLNYPNTANCVHLAFRYNHDRYSGTLTAGVILH